MPDTRPAAAALAMIAAMALIGLVDNFVPDIAQESGVWQFHFVRTLITLPIFAVLAWAGMGTLRLRRPWAVALRSLFVTLAMLLYFAGLGTLPIAQAVAGLFTAPIFVVLISGLLLAERIGAVRVAAAVIGFAGVMLVLRPDPTVLSVWSVVPILSGLFYAMAAIATRRLCADEPPLGLTASMFAGLGIAGGIGVAALTLAGVSVEGSFVLRAWEPLTPAFLSWTGLQAVGSVAAVWLIVRAYLLGEASYVSVFEYALLIFITVWAWVLRGSLPDAPTVAGMALILAAGVTMGLGGRRRAAPA